MKTIFRNFLRTVGRYKMAVALNILGLSVAFAAFMIIMIQLHYDFGFDKSHKDYDKIFRVEFSQNSNLISVVTHPFAEQLFESSSHILDGVLSSGPNTIRFRVEDGGRFLYEEKSFTVTPDFFNVFSFDFVEGSMDGYIAPESVFIPLSMARKLFGNESAVGKQIVNNDLESKTVMAVYRDFPANSFMNNCIFFAIQPAENRDRWDNFNYTAYIRVNNASNTAAIIDNFKRNFSSPEERRIQYNWDDEEAGAGLRLTALKDTHYVADVMFDNTPKASRQTLMILFAIAVAIVVIASINFTNFSTSLAPMRMKNINTQRILGAPLRHLRLSLVAEVIIISLISYFVSLLFVLLLNSTSLTSLVEADLSLSANPLVVFGTALIALFAGLFAGLYPAFYMTSFAPAMALNSSFGRSPKGKKVRNTLIGVQYAASFALIISTSFMYLQNRFMQNSPMGYDKDELMTVDISKIQNSREAFTNQLKAYAGIEDVTYGESVLSSSDRYMGWGRRYKGEGISFEVIPVHYTFLKVVGIDIAEGRDFRAEDANTKDGVYVFNETARKKYDMELGTRIADDQGEIIGFMPDIKFASFRKEIGPMAFYVWGTDNWGKRPVNAYIRVKAGADKRAAMAYIYSTIAEFDTENIYNVLFHDDVMQRLYEKEIALSLLITLFSMIAIFVSIVGVFGLVIFDSECRRKEIATRKVLGASTINIILMFNKVYLRILAICCVIAMPFAWYAVTRWLENFAYKTPLYWWVYLLAFVAVGIITVVTVTFQNWRVANDNPVNAIKSE